MTAIDARDRDVADTSRSRRGLVGAAAGVFRQPFLQAIVRRALRSAVLLLVVSALTFVLTSLTPGNAAEEILGSNATPSALAHVRQELGLNLPLWTQYWHWLDRAVHGDLGHSLFIGGSVSGLVATRLPVTLSLMIGALIVSTIVGVGLGVLSAVAGPVLGRTVGILSWLGYSVPAFWLAGILIVIFAVNIRLFPVSGYVSLANGAGQWAQSLVLPVAALAIGGIAGIAKQTREAMLDALSSEYIRMARANGIGMRSIVLRHALKNAGSRVATMVGLLAVSLLGGTVLVETVFSLPGLGSLLFTAVQEHDLPVVQGVVMCFMIFIVIINFMVDIAYRWLNPKVGRR